MFLTKLKYRIKNIFREFLLYHNSSLEFRAKILTSIISIEIIMRDCKYNILNKISENIYKNDKERATILVSTVIEYHNKIIKNNGLDHDCLILDIEKSIKKNYRFAKKIDIEDLDKFKICLIKNSDKIYHDKMIIFLSNLKLKYQ